MYKYSQMAKCMDCNSNFRGKKQRDVIVYICNGYHNKKSDCLRFAIKESDINETIEKHLKVINKGFNGDHASYIKKIEVYNEEEGYIIKYKDHSHDSVVSRTRLRF